MLIAGGLTLLPGRIMHAVVVRRTEQESGGLARPTRSLSASMSEEKTYVIGTGRFRGCAPRCAASRLVLELWRHAGVTQGMRVMDCGSVVPAMRRSTSPKSSARRDSSRGRAARGIFSTALAGMARRPWPRQHRTRRERPARLCLAGRERRSHLVCRWVARLRQRPGRGRAWYGAGGSPAASSFSMSITICVLASRARSSVFESYVGKIIARWRAVSGEPDIALALPRCSTTPGCRSSLHAPLYSPQR